MVLVIPFLIYRRFTKKSFLKSHNSKKESVFEEVNFLFDLDNKSIYIADVFVIFSKNFIPWHIAWRNKAPSNFDVSW